MRLRLMPEAEEILLEIGIWVEAQNTPGSGNKFVDAFIDKIASYAMPNVKYPACKNKVLASFRLSCIAINDWVIAFKQTKDEFVVHYIVFGPGLK
jgi:hypothetical protein